MKRALTGFIAAAVLLAGSAAAQQRKQQDIDLQAAIRKETVDGDLNGAIKQYAAIVSKYVKSDRAVTAMAMVRMAECYQKMGNAESRKLYDQVLREYADQTEAVTLARARMGGSSQPGRPTNTLVWRGDGVATEGTVSPDGRYISFVDWDTGNLALRETATGQNRVLMDAKNSKTGSWTAFAEESTISRDGKQVAFSWYVEGKGRYELWLANLTGDPNPRRLYDDPNSAWLGPYDWSPDGKWIAVMMTVKDRSGSIGLISVSDGSLRVLRTGGALGNSRMFFSPDGKYVGYDMRQSDVGQHDVWVSATDGTGDVSAVAHRSHDFMMGWSPDGKRLLFGSDRTGSMALWSLPFADGKPQGSPEIIKADLGLADPMGMSRSGALYYGVGGGVVGGSIQIASFDFASGRTSSPHDVSANYLENNVNPCWSPDGKYLAYFSLRGRRGSNFGQVIAIRSADTGQMVRELQPKLSGMLDGWAPDGRSLISSGQDLQGRRGLFRIDAQTGEVALLIETPEDQQSLSGVWSPDGKSIYSYRRVSNGTEYAYFQRDSASAAEKELIRRPFLGMLVLSPDGKYLAAPSTDPATNSRTLLIVPTGGGEPREMMRVASETAPADLRNFTKAQALVAAFWAPDSRSFLVRKRRSSDDNELWQVSLDGRAPRKLDASLSKNIAKFTLNPDGNKVAFRVNEPGPRPSPEVWVLENFLPTTSANK